MVNSTSKACETERSASCAGSCPVNINESERAISKVAGGFLLMYGLSRFSLTTLLLSVAGGAMIYRGMTGHCHLYDALGMSTAEDDDGARSKSREPAGALRDA